MSWISSTLVDANDYMNTIIGQGTDYASILNGLTSRLIGRSICQRNIPNRDLTLVKNPYKRRYEGMIDVITHNMIGDRVNVYEDDGRQILFLDDIGGLNNYLGVIRDEDGDISVKKGVETISGINSKVILNANNLINTIIKTNNKDYRKKYKDYTSKTFEVSKTNPSNYIYFSYDEGGKSTRSQQNKLKNETTINPFTDSFFYEDSLLSKTNELFREGKIRTLISSFYAKDEGGLTQSSIDKEYGVSRGRNLKKSNKTTHGGYDNPYCRVWTTHNQYAKYKDVIRPFIDENGNALSIVDIQSNYGNLRPNGSATRLNENTVLNTNTGSVKIAPTKQGSEEIKKCMFSIENLAWKDSKQLKENQKGEHGGRIMWFPPYGLEFTENIQPHWESQTFIGRGENIFTYSNTERSGTLNFTLLVDHPSTINQWRKAKGEIIDKNEAEQEILRFFAGCDTLDYTRGGKNVKKIDENFKINLNSYKEEKEEKIFRIITFFPNSYSGIDELNETHDSSNVIIGICNSKYEQEPKGEVSVSYPSDKDIITGGSRLKDEYSFALNTFEGMNEYENDIRDTLQYVGDNSTIFSLGEVFDKDFPLTNEKMANNLLLENDLEIIIDGFASSHGTHSINEKLSRRRMKVFGDWIKKEFKHDIKEGKVSIISVNEGDDSENISSLSAKLGRCAVATFKFTSKSDRKPLNNAETISISNENNNMKQSSLYKNQIYSTQDEINISTESDYYSEYEYFRDLQTSDNLLYTKLVDKVKYFNPAFHSLTPEGFNARLTFLQQCTRQGPTSSAGDKNTSGSTYGGGNLAFGRAPYCILKIGDFYHTKICIDAMSINYETKQWDLNPEGIGVQPMLANITINFKFIGGHDLGGPIEKLQNAISANYYANTSVYDSTSIIYKKK